ncbi:MAG: Holliday junction resolvase RuvX [Dehalococcoidales bacterium]|nr:Holliday junction resolvase RuvX [Dehalococcoidales bacterium]
MALDVGDARIGLALSDPLGIIATPLTIITRRDIDADIQSIIDIVSKNKVERIIVGMPFSMDGSLGIQADKVRAFAGELSRRVDVPMEYRDERLSTVEAKRMLQEVKKTSRSTRYDAAAAALILQGYLDDLLLPRDYSPDEDVDT